MSIFRQLELLFASSSIPTHDRSSKHRKTRTTSRSTRQISASQGLMQTIQGAIVTLTNAKNSTRQSSQKPRKRQKRASDEFLLTVWLKLRKEFFPDHPHIDQYTVTWSARPQKRVLASCNIQRQRVVVAQELFEPSASRWIAPVLYHEMCHAVIGEGVHLSQSGKRLWHGQQFRQLEARHPDIKAMNAWIATGGWAMAVRSHRARQAWQRRRTS